MDKPLEITFRNLDRSESVVATIRERYAELERFYHHIIGINVKIEMPHKHHRRGNHFEVTIEATVPGQKLVVGGSSDRRVRSETLPVAVHDAFKAMTRKLEDYARIRRGDKKHHEVSLTGWVAHMFPDYGFIRLADGREVYFHKNSVVYPEYEKLEEGMPVRLIIAENESEAGPQASTVEAIRNMEVFDKRSSPFKTTA